MLWPNELRDLVRNRSDILPLSPNKNVFWSPWLSFLLPQSVNIGSPSSTVQYQRIEEQIHAEGAGKLWPLILIQLSRIYERTKRPSKKNIDIVFKCKVQSWHRETDTVKSDFPMRFLLGLWAWINCLGPVRRLLSYYVLQHSSFFTWIVEKRQVQYVLFDESFGYSDVTNRAWTTHPQSYSNFRPRATNRQPKSQGVSNLTSVAYRTNFTVYYTVPRAMGDCSQTASVEVTGAKFAAQHVAFIHWFLYFHYYNNCTFSITTVDGTARHIILNAVSSN